MGSAQARPWPHQPLKPPSPFAQVCPGHVQEDRWDLPLLPSALQGEGECQLGGRRACSWQVVSPKFSLGWGHTDPGLLVSVRSWVSDPKVLPLHPHIGAVLFIWLLPQPTWKGIHMPHGSPPPPPPTICWARSPQVPPCCAGCRPRIGKGQPCDMGVLRGRSRPSHREQGRTQRVLWSQALPCGLR